MGLDHVQPLRRRSCGTGEEDARLQGFLAVFGVVTGPAKGLSAGFSGVATPGVWRRRTHRRLRRLSRWQGRGARLGAAAFHGAAADHHRQARGIEQRLATRFTSARVTAWIRALRRAT